MANIFKQELDLEIVAKAIFREKKLSNDANDDEILED